MSYVLEVKNLKKSFGKKEPFVAVDSISFDLRAGEILGLLGPNGCGKTTTIQMLLGTLDPTEGKIRYFGKDLFKERSTILQHVSFASTYTSLPYVLTVEENLICFGHLYDIKNPLKEAEEFLRRFGIYELRKKKVSSLSAGQVTRLMLVKAFFTRPKIVLLDEPTASLDPDVARDTCAFLLEQRAKTGVSLLFTSHKMDEVAQVCDRVIVLKKGKIIADDLPKNLASSVSFYRLRLTIVDGMKRAVAIAQQRGLKPEVQQRIFSCALDEKEIPPFLHALMKKDVSYANIQIEEPSLEDYFFSIVEDV